MSSEGFELGLEAQYLDVAWAFKFHSLEDIQIGPALTNMVDDVSWPHMPSILLLGR
jgi:hypothetical protein